MTGPCLGLGHARHGTPSGAHKQCPRGSSHPSPPFGPTKCTGGWRRRPVPICGAYPPAAIPSLPLLPAQGVHAHQYSHGASSEPGDLHPKSPEASRLDQTCSGMGFMKQLTSSCTSVREAGPNSNCGHPGIGALGTGARPLATVPREPSLSPVGRGRSSSSGLAGL